LLRKNPRHAESPGRSVGKIRRWFHDHGPGAITEEAGRHGIGLPQTDRGPLRSDDQHRSIALHGDSLRDEVERRQKPQACRVEIERRGARFGQPQIALQEYGGTRNRRCPEFAGRSQPWLLNAPCALLADSGWSLQGAVLGFNLACVAVTT